MSEQAFLSDASDYAANEVFGGERQDDDEELLRAAYAYIGLTPEQAQDLRDGRATLTYPAAQ